MELSEECVDLINLCNTNPELANNIVSNITKFPALYKKTIDGIPTNIILTKPLSSKHLNKLIKVSGSIIKTYPVFFKNVTSEQTCLKCNETIYLSEQETIKTKGNSVCYSCGSTNLKTVQNFQQSFPIQNIRIQDMSNHSAMSETIEICIEGDKAGVFLPGDKVSIAGIVLRKWKPLRPNEPMVSSLYIKVLQIIKDCDDDDEFSEIKPLVDEYNEKSVFDKRRFILESFCSEIYGLSNVKLGLLLALVGGINENKDASQARSSSHVLLVGDPGTGKSHLLKAVSRLVSPSVFTNGVGTSDAGLTSCAVRQGKEWTLEAGALVLADTGICCIDEFNKLKINEKSGLLESMEQQTLSVAKAGMVTSLNSRCSVIAVSGTRYNYDFRKTICDNLGISSPLISRFDLIFGIFDRRKSKDRDNSISDQIIGRDMQIKLPETSKWSQSTLRAFISQCRKIKNKISEDVCQILLKYYSRKRTIDGVNEFNTIRLLESLVRLSEAHSKLMSKDSVDEEDAFSAIILMETTINGISTIDFDVDEVFINEQYFKKTKDQLCKKFNICC